MDAFQGSLLLILLFLLATALLRYHRYLFYGLGRGLARVVAGLFFLFVINLLAGFVDTYVPYNVVTVAIAALLGLPGALALLGIQLYLHL